MVSTSIQVVPLAASPGGTDALSSQDGVNLKELIPSLKAFYKCRDLTTLSH